jgi:heme o synthase
MRGFFSWLLAPGYSNPRERGFQGAKPLGDYLELTKPRITLLVLFVTFVGFYAGTQGQVQFWILGHTLLGTALVAGGASALNMYAERKLDALMTRTASRPLATGRLRAHPALFFALAMSLGGFIYLHYLVNPLTSWLSGIILAGYLFLYTPLKTRTWLCTLVGAIPGALPIVLGWTATGNTPSPGAWALFFIVFLWQLPHFYAIGWMYREDYSRAGLPVLSVIDRSGRRVGLQTVIFISALIIVSLIPALIGIAGMIYLVGAAVLGFIFLMFGFNFSRSLDILSARLLFGASALYLPGLLIILVLDK